MQSNTTNNATTKLSDHHSATVMLVNKYELRPVFPAAGQKSPPNGWKDNTAVELSETLNSPLRTNVGAFMGGRLVDLDIDTDNELFKEALIKFDNLIHNGGSNHIFGSLARPNTHFIYEYNDDSVFSLKSLIKYVSKYNLDGEAGAFNLELMGSNPDVQDASTAPDSSGTGSANYTLLPPSYVKNKKATEEDVQKNYRLWQNIDRAFKPATITNEVFLRKMVGFAVASAALAHYWPVLEGSRHKVVQALIGGIARRYLDDNSLGLTDVDCENFLVTFIDVSDDVWKGIRQDFNKTVRKLEQGDNTRVTGFNTVASIIFGENSSKGTEFVHLLSMCFGENPRVASLKEIAREYILMKNRYYDIEEMHKVGYVKCTPYDAEGFKNYLKGSDYIMAPKRNKDGVLEDKPMSLHDFVTDNYYARYLPTVSRVVFDPSVPKPLKPTDMLSVNTIKRGKEFYTLNLWTGFEVDEYAGSLGHGDIPEFRRLMQELFLTEHERNIFLQFIKELFITPGKRAETAIIFTGEQGTGKSVIAQIVGRIVGPKHFFDSPTLAPVLDKFNNLLATKILVNVNETEAKLKESKGLKASVTATESLLEKKGQDKYVLDNFTRYIGSSNKENPLQYDDDGFGGDSDNDRRFHIIGVSNRLSASRSTKISGVARETNAKYWDEFLKNVGLVADHESPLPKDGTLSDAARLYLSKIRKEIVSGNYAIDISTSHITKAKKMAGLHTDLVAAMLVNIIKNKVAFDDIVFEKHPTKVFIDHNKGATYDCDIPKNRSIWPSHFHMDAVHCQYDYVNAIGKSSNNRNKFTTPVAIIEKMKKMGLIGMSTKYSLKYTEKFTGIQQTSSPKMQVMPSYESLVEWAVKEQYLDKEEGKEHLKEFNEYQESIRSGMTDNDDETGYEKGGDRDTIAGKI